MPGFHEFCDPDVGQQGGDDDDQVVVVPGAREVTVNKTREGAQHTAADAMFASDKSIQAERRAMFNRASGYKPEKQRQQKQPGPLSWHYQIFLEHAYLSRGRPKLSV